MMDKCIEQRNTKVVEDPGYFSTGKTMYDNSSPHCATVAREYARYNTIDGSKKKNDFVRDDKKIEFSEEWI